MPSHTAAPDWSYQETKKKLLSIEDQRAKDFAIFAYCFGGRINEIRSIRPEEITTIIIPNGEERINLYMKCEKNPNMSYRNIPLNPFNEPEYAKVILNWKQDMLDSNTYPLLKNYFHKRFLKIKHRCEEKGIPCKVDEMVRPFSRFTERSYNTWMHEHLDIHPHALRHLRVHHVDDNSIPGMKALTPRQFKDFFGWERIETSSHYQSRTRSKDLAERM